MKDVEELELFQQLMEEIDDEIIKEIEYEGKYGKDSLEINENIKL